MEGHQDAAGEDTEVHGGLVTYVWRGTVPQIRPIVQRLGKEDESCSY